MVSKGASILSGVSVRPERVAQKTLCDDAVTRDDALGNASHRRLCDLVAEPVGRHQARASLSDIPRQRLIDMANDERDVSTLPAHAIAVLVHRCVDAITDEKVVGTFRRRPQL